METTIELPSAGNSKKRRTMSQLRRLGSEDDVAILLLEASEAEAPSGTGKIGKIEVTKFDTEVLPIRPTYPILFSDAKKFRLLLVQFRSTS